MCSFFNILKAATVSLIQILLMIMGLVVFVPIASIVLFCTIFSLTLRSYEDEERGGSITISPHNGESDAEQLLRIKNESWLCDIKKRILCFLPFYELSSWFYIYYCRRLCDMSDIHQKTKWKKSGIL